MGQFVNMDGEEGSVVRLVTELLQIGRAHV